MALAKAGFVLSVKPISVLRPHEQTIPAHVQGLTSEMKRDGIQKDPIIIDQDTATVLDGMHRLAAFETLHVDNAVCCGVDYSSKAVTVGRWARVYSIPNGGLQVVLEELGITQRARLAEAFDAIENRDTGLAAFSSVAAYLPGKRLDLGQAIDVIEGLDQTSASRGWKRSFVPEEDIDVPLQSDRNLVVMISRLGKDDIVKAARSGNLFPCKTSMHRIDPRPVAVNFPLEELNRATSASLRRALEGAEEQLLPPDSMYEGRRYKERLLLLGKR